jgi:hypothetical protein
MMFSIVHPTRWRPHVLAGVYAMWCDRAEDPHRAEYVWSPAEDDQETLDAIAAIDGPIPQRVVSGPHDGGVVLPTNRGVYAARGNIIIATADDMEPPQGWDRLILERIPNINAPAMLAVGDGGNGTASQYTTHPIATRAWVELAGYLFYPDYLSWYCDNDITAKARHDGTIINAWDLTFLHRWGPASGFHQDRTYRSENQPRAAEIGERVFAERAAAGFPDEPDRWGYCS